MSDTSDVLAAPDIHDVVWVRGPDTIRFLDGLISQDVAGMAEGDVAHSFLLAPNGKLRAPLVVWRGTDEVALVTSRGTGQTVAGDLTRFKIRVDVDIEVETRPVITLVGEGAGAVIAASGLAAPDDDRWSRGDVSVGIVPFARGGPERLVVVGGDIEELAGAGARPVSSDHLETLRIERGEPLFGRDVDEGTIPQEMGDVQHAVSFTKGCYLGQELVARIDSRGHVNRHLRAVVLADGALPPTGAELRAVDKVVGNLTSVSRSDRLGTAIGMALVRREVGPGDVVEVTWDGGSLAGEIRELPLD